MITIKDLLENLDITLVILEADGKVKWSNHNYADYSQLLFLDNKGDFFLEKQDKWIRINNKKINEYQLLTIIDITTDKKREEELNAKIFEDLVTGIFNRTGVNYYLEKAIKDFEKEGEKFSIVMADIDFFKNVNDVYGHAVGDAVLQEVGKILSDNIRKDDFVGRYGGEEFLIILQTSEVSKVKKRLEAIRRIIENHQFLIEKLELKITMTFGSSVYDGKNGLETVLKKADEALYYGKRHGRNKVILSEELID